MLEGPHACSGLCVPKNQYCLRTLKWGNANILPEKSEELAGAKQPVKTNSEQQVEGEPPESVEGTPKIGEPTGRTGEGEEDLEGHGDSIFRGDPQLPNADAIPGGAELPSKVGEASLHSQDGVLGLKQARGTRSVEPLHVPGERFSAEIGVTPQ